MGHGIAQAIGIKVVFNHTFTAPTRVAAGKVGFAIVVGIKQCRDFRVFKLFDIGDVVFISCFFIDQVTLKRPR